MALSHAPSQTPPPAPVAKLSLPGGKTLHVMPRAIDGGMIAIQVVLFDGKRTSMTVDMALESGDTFALGGEQYGKGTLLIRISPTTISRCELL
jgi:hypothetical protein